MTKLTELSDSLETTIKNSDLHAISVDAAELMLDSLISDGLVKDIPVFGTLINLIKLTGSIRDKLFAKKLIYFLSELADTNSEERADILLKIEKEKGYRGKIGEKLLYIIDRCEDHFKAQVIARIFSAFVRHELSYAEFLRASSIIDKVYSDDLNWFVSDTEERVNIDSVGFLVNSGLYEIESPEIMIRDQDDWKMPDTPYIVEGSELTVYISDIGKKIRRILNK